MNTRRRALKTPAIIFVIPLLFVVMSGSTAAGFGGGGFSFPTPNIPRPRPPTISLPTLNIPTPNIPTRPPTINDIRRETGNLDQERLRAQREAQAVVNRYNELQRQATQYYQEYQRIQQTASGGNRELRAQAYRQLRNSGSLGSNKAAVMQSLRSGLTVLVPAAEIDHLDQYQFVSALATSVATANPGPVLAWLQQMLLESKAVFQRNLNSVPDEVRYRLQQEFERLLIRALDQAANGGRPLQFAFSGVTVVAGLATFSNWIEASYQEPQLVRNGSYLGIQLYRIELSTRHLQLPIPNTFMPYARIQVNYRTF